KLLKCIWKNKKAGFNSRIIIQSSHFEYKRSKTCFQLCTFLYLIKYGLLFYNIGSKWTEVATNHNIHDTFFRSINYLFGIHQVLKLAEGFFCFINFLLFLNNHTADLHANL